MTTKTKNRPFAAELDTRADNTNNVLNFVATTSGIKRDGLDINIAGMSTENFLKNPVVLWAHDYGGQRPPIGKVTSIRTLKQKMKVRVMFDDQDDFAMQVKSKLDRGYLNTVSIGWETLDFDRETSTVVESDLLDVSVVPVPGDPDALIERQKVALRSLGQDLLDRFTDEDLPADFEHDAVCPECDAPLTERYKTAPDAEGISTAYCVDCADKILEKQAFAAKWLQDDARLHDINCSMCGGLNITSMATGGPIGTTMPTSATWGERGCTFVVPDSTGTTPNITITGFMDDPAELADRVRQALSGSGPDQRSDGNAAQTLKEGEMERLERVVAALDELRTAMVDLIDSAEADDNDQSKATLLAVFDNDQGEED